MYNMTMHETLYAYDMYGKKKIYKYAFRVENENEYYVDVETAVNCSKFKKKTKQLKIKIKEKAEQKFWNEILKKKQQGYTNNSNNITSLKSNKHVIVYQNQLKRMSLQNFLDLESNDVLFRMKQGSIPVLIYLESENTVVVKVNNVRIKTLHVNNEMRKIFEYSKAFQDLVFEGFLESETTDNLEKTATCTRKLCSIQNSLKLKIYNVTIPDQTDMEQQRKLQFLQVIYDIVKPNSSMIEIASVTTQIDNSFNFITNNSIIVEST
jgi:hypothetical protein